jgi:hypothetical protein
MQKLTYDEVVETFASQGCKLLTKSYKNNKQQLTYLCTCGHERSTSLSNFKYYKDSEVSSYTLCKRCISEKYTSNYFKVNKNAMHPKTFQKVKRIMERRYEMTKKYRSDFYPENYNRTLTCWDCKETKSMRLFPYRKQYKDNKEKRCKQCIRENHTYRRDHHTIEQFTNEMILSTKRNSRLRESRGRKECGINTITVDDVLTLKSQQNNICIYSGRTLVWERNHPDKASIDRIDSSKGYTPDNIQLVTHLVNQAKSNLDHDEFIHLISDIYMHQTQHPLHN